MPKILFKPAASIYAQSSLSSDSHNTRSSNKLPESVAVGKTHKLDKKNKKNEGVGKPKCKRSRKTYDQIIVLLKYFKQDPAWSRSTVQKIKRELNMKTSQIYKWGYDQKMKESQSPSDGKSDRNGHFSVGTETDTYMTDSSINDYNSAVVTIGDSIANNKPNEELTRKNCSNNSDLGHTGVSEKNSDKKYFINNYTNESVGQSIDETHSKLLTASGEVDSMDNFQNVMHDDFYYQFMKNENLDYSTGLQDQGLDLLAPNATHPEENFFKL